MTYGVAVGKFWPFHKGHEYLIRRGAAKCDLLHVIVCSSRRYGGSAAGDHPALRGQWILDVCRDLSLHLHVFDQDASDLADHDSEGWAKATLELVKTPIDVAVCSEDYGPDYAKFLGARCLMVDQARRVVPVSGTMIRGNPTGYAHYLDSIVLHDLLA